MPGGFRMLTSIEKAEIERRTADLDRHQSGGFHGKKFVSISGWIFRKDDRLHPSVSNL